jgi:hypothetical protein
MDMGTNEFGGREIPSDTPRTPHKTYVGAREVWAIRTSSPRAKNDHERKKPMSLAIEVDDITHVLLADGWHTVHDASFGIDSYEFIWREGMGDSPMLGGGQDKHIAAAGHRGSTSREHIAAAGFSFTEGDHVLCGPLTSVLAVKVKSKRQHSM